jgi:hypothetical protein
MSFATMSQEEADDLLKITADSLAKRAGVDASGPLTDDGFTDEQRVTRLKMQVSTHTKDKSIPPFSHMIKLGYGQRWPRPRQTQLLGCVALSFCETLLRALIPYYFAERLRRNIFRR